MNDNLLGQTRIPWCKLHGARDRDREEEEEKKNRTDEPRFEHLVAIVLDRSGRNRLSKSRLPYATYAAFATSLSIGAKNRLARRTSYVKYGKALKLIAEALSVPGRFAIPRNANPQCAKGRCIDARYY